MTHEKMEAEFEDLRSRLSINVNSLHKDARIQPDLMARAGELLAECKMEMRRARLEADESKAHASRQIREDPEHYGIEKATQAAVDAAVLLTTSVKQASRELTDASYDVDRAAALADAFQHRKSMIQDEVRLYLGNYWGECDVKDMKDAEADVREDVEKKATEKRRRRRRRPTNERDE